MYQGIIQGFVHTVEGLEVTLSLTAPNLPAITHTFSAHALSPSAFIQRVKDDLAKLNANAALAAQLQEWVKSNLVLSAAPADGDAS